MLRSLTVRNFLVIQDATLNLAPGLNALIGETGAGKSVLVEALALLCGLKSGGLTPRDVTKKAFAEAVFDVSSWTGAQCQRVADYLDGEEELILSLSATAKGSIVRRINGETVTLQTLREAMQGVVDIHSQRDTAGLYDPAVQLAGLDGMGDRDHQKLISDYRQSLAEMNEAQKAIDELRSESASEDPDFLRFRIDEIERLHIQPDEIEEAEAKLSELSGQAKLNEALKSLSPLRSQLEQILPELSSSLDSISSIPGEASSLAQEALDSLNSLENNLDSISYLEGEEETELVDQLNARLFDLEKVRSRYGRSTKEILDALDSLKSRLDKLSNFEDELKRLQNRLYQCTEEATRIGRELSASRKSLAKDIAKLVNANLNDLKLPSSGFDIKVETGNKLLSTGLDHVEFTVDLNGRGRFEPLRKVASGGESSRIMLALKCALAGVNPADLMVFDEIDTGISGAVAFQAGRKLAALSRSVQVCCITHLPQVAAFADQAFLVTKKPIDGGVSMTGVESLSDSEALARGISVLLEGSESSRVTIDAAKDLIDQAHRAEASKKS